MIVRVESDRLDSYHMAYSGLATVFLHCSISSLQMRVLTFLLLERSF